MAQLVAHLTGSEGVRGSNPLSSTHFEGRVSGSGLLIAAARISPQRRKGIALECDTDLSAPRNGVVVNSAEAFESDPSSGSVPGFEYIVRYSVGFPFTVS